jgi:hypothetical protein
MDSPLAIDHKNKLVEVRPSVPRQPALIRIFAKIISYIFHPLFIPLYLCWLVVSTQSYLFAVFSPWQRTIFIVRFGVMYIMFPLLSVLLMRALGFISSFQLKTQRDRVIPYVVCMVYYWWMWFVLHNQPEYPAVFVTLSFAIFLASIGGLLVNINMKVSMHAMAAGVMIGFVMLLGFSQDINFGVYISLAIFITGAICTARFIDSDHTPKEIYTGLIIGIVSLLLAIKFA